jgi:hypothetical protein
MNWPLLGFHVRSASPRAGHPGGGLDDQYVHVRLTQAIDFGSAGAAVLGGATCAGAFGLTPGASDGQVDNSGDGFGYGFNLGALMSRSPARASVSPFAAPSTSTSPMEGRLSSSRPTHGCYLASECHG